MHIHMAFAFPILSLYGRRPSSPLSLRDRYAIQTLYLFNRHPFRSFARPLPFRPCSWPLHFVVPLPFRPSTCNRCSFDPLFVPLALLACLRFAQPDSDDEGLPDLEDDDEAQPDK